MTTIFIFFVLKNGYKVTWHILRKEVVKDAPVLGERTLDCTDAVDISTCF